jgi:polyisoprenoid-binding protein YceI
MTTTKWVIDPAHSEIGFKIRHLMITHVSGNFKAFNVELETGGEDFTTAKIQARIQAASINTNNLQRDEHLRSSDFFEAENYPEILFTSTKVEKDGDATFLLHGNLTLKGITRPLQLNVEYSGVTKDPWGGQRAGFVLSGKINRSEWGVTFNTVLETGGVALSDEVKINGEVQLVKQVASVAA